MSDKARFVEYLITKLTDLGLIKVTPKYKKRIFDRVHFEEDIKDLRAQREAARESLLKKNVPMQISLDTVNSLPCGEEKNRFGDNTITQLPGDNSTRFDSFEKRTLKSTIDTILDEQFNKEAIVIESIYESVDMSNIHQGEIDTDFIKTVLNNAKNIPDKKELRTLWAKMLAQGACDENRFSIRTIEVLKGLSHKEIQIFTNLCQFNLDGGIVDLEEQSIIAGFPYDNFKKYGLSYQDVSVMQDARLVDSPTPFALKSFLALQNGGLTTIFGKTYLLKLQESFSRLFLPFTEAGRQLAQLTETPPNPQYLADFFSLITQKGGTLTLLG